MDHTKINERIQVIMDTFGMSGKKAADIIGISYLVFRQNKAGNKGHYFTEKHCSILISYIKEQAAVLV